MRATGDGVDVYDAIPVAVESMAEVRLAWRNFKGV